MVPAAAGDQEIAGLVLVLPSDDVVGDGGSSLSRDDIRRGAGLGKKGIHLLDVGTSGGVAGLDRGSCLMIGGEPEPVRRRSRRSRGCWPGPGVRRMASRFRRLSSRP